LKRLLGIGVVIGCLSLGGGASAALVKVGNLVLTADGGFTPRQLPRRTYAPIDFRGFANLRSTDGSVPAPLQQVVVDFDRDGRLSTGGLPICEPASLQNATTGEARGRCRGAIVGAGHIRALISSGGGAAVEASSPLTIFNGPREAGEPTVVLHAQTAVPEVQTFVITVPIERRGGAYSYRATVDVPPIASGLGSITHLDVKVGKRYRFRGAERSYASARCGDGIFRTHGRFTFADGVIIDGSIEKACTAR
jgi:hypothetical protein